MVLSVTSSRDRTVAQGCARIQQYVLYDNKDTSTSNELHICGKRARIVNLCAQNTDYLAKYRKSTKILVYINDKSNMLIQPGSRLIRDLQCSRVQDKLHQQSAKNNRKLRILNKCERAQKKKNGLHVDNWCIWESNKCRGFNLSQRKRSK